MIPFGSLRIMGLCVVCRLEMPGALKFKFDLVGKNEWVLLTHSTALAFSRRLDFSRDIRHVVFKDYCAFSLIATSFCP